jgi:hypothetical protein
VPQLALALRVLDASVLWDDLRRSAGVLKSDPWASAELTARRPAEGAVAGGERGWEYLLDGVEVCNIHGYRARASIPECPKCLSLAKPFQSLATSEAHPRHGADLIGLRCACRACLMTQGRSAVASFSGSQALSRACQSPLQPTVTA